MVFTEGDLDSLTLEGKGTATYAPADRKAFSRLFGARMRIGFQGGAIRRVLIEGEAVCEHAPQGGGEESIRLTGDRVELTFEEGDLKKALAAGGVKGRYVPVREGADR